MSDRLQNPIGYRVPSSWVCSRAQPIWCSYASVSKENGNQDLGRFNTGVQTRACLSRLNSFLSSSPNFESLVGHTLRSSAFKGATVRAKFGTNHRYTLHKSRKELNSVCVVGTLDFSTASVFLYSARLSATETGLDPSNKEMRCCNPHITPSFPFHMDSNFFSIVRNLVCTWVSKCDRSSSSKLGGLSASSDLV